MEAVATQHRTERNVVKRDSEQHFNNDMMLKLYELLQGEREVVKVYSKVLNSDLYFVNPELQERVEDELECPTYTTRELSFVLSMTAEELQQYHYLKTRLS